MGSAGRERRQNFENFVDQFRRTLARHRGDGKFFVFAAFFAEFFHVLFRAVHVAFVQNDDLRQRRQLFAVLFEFGVYFFEILVRIAPFHARNIHYVAEHARALDMPEKVVPQPLAVRRALDETGDIRRHERLFVAPHHAEIGRKRGKMIICDLRPRRADLG